eukprot:TRINITY_DN11574_c0_g1_i1.p1 TRINITY_DN11574_c0_g1~~TRINITY_DN11574_c0_g1_i1.p1  ORF type:complete len:327 (-),score=73.33 TRINITY_DN11574_c0_g1_i1:64-1008(-)
MSFKPFAHFQGLISAPLTAFHPADGSVDLSAIAPYAQWLCKSGVEGVFVNGTTGEGQSLTTEERKATARAWAQAAPPGFKVIVHVSHTSIAESRQLAAHAQEIGAWGVGALAPFFFKPKSIAELVADCAQIASAAPDLPFYYYHIPSITGVNFAMIDLLKAITPAVIPNFAGIKYTWESLMDFNFCRRFDNGRFNMLFGRDEMYLGALAFGSTGAVGSTYNYMAPLFVRMRAAFESGNVAEAQRLQSLANDVIQLVSDTGSYFSGAKAVIEYLGVVPVTSTVRHPLSTISAAKRDELFQKLESISFRSEVLPAN